MVSVNGVLPQELSPWGMFMSADAVVKGVMIGLAFASLATWTVWLAKTIEIWLARRAVRRELRVLSLERSLSSTPPDAFRNGGLLAALLAAASIELRLSSDTVERSGVKERVASRLADVRTAAGRAIRSGTGVLASIGATAPFVGLFGTVWGVMNSFIGISKAQTTNLAIVAPGIAEALLATAIGLVAAIPAVILYNQLARSISAYKALVGEASSEVERLVSRDLDRATGGHYHLRAARPGE